ncbi:hypothetical protein B0G76_8664 [Paraburkholderia sp. BL23I1N1]|uniref:hypothetical protein n=1 Tax=Paraburkholderia sp. BL23I1N1 TaxID=1938802 RepID=UPI000FEDE553|nr:hypothetical protein [Paraburkholderia sp. BL23I1N1]RKE23962.1 hypothetical protein B0G76_8664 [Paraburkholderia sp. BL23I1N1]
MQDAFLNGAEQFAHQAHDRPLTLTSGECVEFCEGARVAVPDGSSVSTRGVVSIAILGSMTLAGKPVRCSGVVPGVTMWVSTGALRPRDADESEQFIDDIWEKIRPGLVDWLTMRTSPAGVTMALGADIRLEFGWDDRHRVRDGAMEIDVKHDPTFAAAYMKRRRQYPIVERSPEPGDTARLQGAQLRGLLVTALEKSIQTHDALYARLPASVRYRATGALTAWREFRREAEAFAPASLASMLRADPPTKLVQDFAEVTRRMLPHGVEGVPPEDLAVHASHSVIWQAFDERLGALYEPTPALHRLLEQAYIADDVPVGALELPVETLCIIPEPSRWTQPGECESIALFRGTKPTSHGTSQIISFVTCSRRADVRRSVLIDALDMSLDDPGRTVRELLDDAFAEPQPGDEEIRQHWRHALDYAIKMLLYLTARDAHVVHDRAYTQAPREFGGLGKRRRAERLAQIEQLYDRHIVGPAILDAESMGSLLADGVHHEVRGHWRRPHFRMQPYGPNSSLRKLAFIGPTIVRPDRLGL